MCSPHWEFVWTFALAACTIITSARLSGRRAASKESEEGGEGTRPGRLPGKEPP